MRKTLAAGGGVVFLTVTVGHTRLDRLRDVIDRLRNVASVITSGAAALSQTVPGYIGTTSTLEITDGRNGWHPHRHILLFTETPLTADQLTALENTLRAQLVARAAKIGATVEPAHVLDVQAVDSEGVGGYLAKIAQELADAGAKQSQTPWTHLDDTDPTHIARWCEFVDATTGLHRWQNSPRLTQRLQTQLGITLEPITEGEIVETLELPLPPTSWRRLPHIHRIDVLYAYALHGAAAALHTLRSVVIIA